MWYDELFSIGVAGLPTGDSLRAVVADHTHPPLFYVLLKVWMLAGGESDAWVRLLPCLFAILLGAGVVWLAREARAGAAAGALAVALAAASPLAVDLANEVRDYSLLALLACLSLAATLYDRRVRTRHSFVLLALINVALVHSHYFGWLTVGAEVAVSVALWQRDEARRVLKSALCAALAFVPWAAAVLAHALRTPAPLRNVAWIVPPTVSAPASLLSDFTGRSGVMAADVAWLSLVAVALLALLVMRRRGVVLRAPTDNATLVLLAAAGLGMPLIVWVASLSGAHSVWVPRYMIGSAAPTALLVAIAVTALPPRRWAAAAAVGFVWAAVAFAALPKRPPAKFDWRRFTRRIETSVGGPKDLYALEAFTGAPLMHYAGPGTRLRMIASLDDLPLGDSWLVYRRESFASGSASDALKARGFSVVTALSAETAGQRFVAVRVRR